MSKESEEMRGLARKCDAELSIEARRILKYETHCLKECAELVWAPAKEFLGLLAEGKPKYLWCCRSRPFYPNYPNDPDEECVDIDIIGPGLKTAFLGTVVNTKHAISIWTMFAKNRLKKARTYADALPEAKGSFDRYADGLAKLLETGPLAIFRENIGCHIPVIAEKISRRVAEKGIRKALGALMPCLAGLPIRWVPEKEQEAFVEFVEAEAKRMAVPQNDEERREIFNADVE